MIINLHWIIIAIALIPALLAAYRRTNKYVELLPLSFAIFLVSMLV